jgi:hypothetical protein
MSTGDMFNSNKTGLASVFSGADTVVIFGDEYVGECMSFTVGVNRESGPLYVMGRKSPIAIPKGKRGIGGSFILAQLGYDALISYVSKIFSQSSSAPKVWIRQDESDLQAKGYSDKNLALNPATTSAGATVNVPAGGALAKSDLWTEVDPFYADQIPPFNITVVGVNEQGDKMAFRIFGCTVINEGVAISIDELNIEKKYTFIANSMSPMRRLDQ